MSKRNKKELDSVRVAKIEQRERVVRKGRAKQERLRRFVRFLLTLGFLAAGYYAVLSSGWVLKQDAFTHADGVTIEIVNNKIVPAAKILAILENNKLPDTPVYLMKTAAIKKQIKQLDPVEDVYIRRYAFPARLQIILREKIPAVTLSPDLNSPPRAFVTQDGSLITQGYKLSDINKDFETIKVLSSNNNDWNEAKVKQIQKIISHVEAYSEEPVEYIDIRKPDDVFVKIKTVNIRLGKLDEGVYERLKHLPALLPQVKQTGAKIKYLDLSWEKVHYLKLE